jgi:transcriptional regulator with XRE-family HTH domain
LLPIVNSQLHRVKYLIVTVNERVRAIRLHKKWGTQELARRAGLSAAAISRLENGPRMPRVDTVQKIASAYDVSTSFLLGEEGTDIDLAKALARESLRLYVRHARLSVEDQTVLGRIASEDSAPQNREDWQKLRKNLTLVGVLH